MDTTSTVGHLCVHYESEKVKQLLSKAEQTVFICNASIGSTICCTVPVKVVIRRTLNRLSLLARLMLTIYPDYGKVVVIPAGFRIKLKSLCQCHSVRFAFLLVSEIEQKNRTNKERVLSMCWWKDFNFFKNC